MIEKREGTGNEALHVDARRIFLPFKDKKELQAADLDKASSTGEMALLLEKEIEFKGIAGAVKIWADPIEQGNFLTPLGDVHRVVTHSNRAAQITEAPCIMELRFESKTEKEFDILSDYQAQVFLNDEVYYLDCDGCVDSEFAYHEFKKGNRVSTGDWNLKDKDGCRVYLRLPQNIKDLSTIKMRLIEYDNDDNDDTETDITPPPSSDLLKIS